MIMGGGFLIGSVNIRSRPPVKNLAENNRCLGADYKGNSSKLMAPGICVTETVCISGWLCHDIWLHC